MATINVLIAVDAATLAQQVKDGSIKPGSQSNPTFLGSYAASDVYISMITQSGNVDNTSQGQSELQIKCNSGDTVQWAITSFTNNFNHSVFLYAGVFSPADAMNAMSYNSSQVKNYLPAAGGTTIGPLTKYINQVVTAQANVARVGLSIQYYLSFQLIDNSKGTVIGYFAWDPFINVN
jgi:nematocidal protein AidA